MTHPGYSKVNLLSLLFISEKPNRCLQSHFLPNYSLLVRYINKNAQTRLYLDVRQLRTCTLVFRLSMPENSLLHVRDLPRWSRMVLLWLLTFSHANQCNHSQHVKKTGVDPGLFKSLLMSKWCQGTFPCSILASQPWPFRNRPSGEPQFVTTKHWVHQMYKEEACQRVNAQSISPGTISMQSSLKCFFFMHSGLLFRTHIMSYLSAQSL